MSQLSEHIRPPQGLALALASEVSSSGVSQGTFTTRQRDGSGWFWTRDSSDLENGLDDLSPPFLRLLISSSLTCYKVQISAVVVSRPQGQLAAVAEDTSEDADELTDACVVSGASATATLASV